MMEKNLDNFQENKNEKKENVGHNTTVTFNFARHSEKQSPDVLKKGEDKLSDSSISDKGHEMARDFGSEVDKKPNKSYDVPAISRTTETLKSVFEGAEMPYDEKEVGEFFSIQGISLAGEFGKKFGEIINEHKQECLEEMYPGKKWEELNSSEQGKVVDAAGDYAVDWYLSLDKEKPTPNDLSPYEFASNVAYKLNRIINLSDHMPNNKEVDLLSVGNKTSTEGLLSYCLVRKEEGKEVVGFDSVQEIGGGLQVMEDWTLKVHNDENGKKTVTVFLRGKEYGLDMEKLKEMAEDSRKNKGKEKLKIDD